MMDDLLEGDLDRARRGDREAVMRLLGKHDDRLRRLIHDRLGAGLRAKLSTSDVLQSTYLDILRGIRNFEGKTAEEFVGWFTRLVENNIRDKAKYFGARKRQGGEALPEDALDEQPISGSGPASFSALVDDLRLVHESLDALNEDYRKAILLKFMEGKSPGEIAGQLGRTEAAVRVLLVRARAGLLLEIDRRKRLRGRPS